MLDALPHAGPPIGVTEPAWAAARREGSAPLLHGTEPPDRVRPTVWFLEVTEPWFVLGSNQSENDVDPEAARRAGTAVTKRRSGGGGVLLVPGEHLWVDFWVPRGSCWWDDDVGRAGDWLAAVWLEALVAMGHGDLAIHRGPMTRTAWSRQVCFAGVGPGEVLAGGRKLVGISQRRTRHWARFQCVVHHRWDADATFGLLRDDGALAAAAAWRDRVAVVADGDLPGALLRALPQA